MRSFALIVLAVMAMLESSQALVDAGDRTTVGVWANAWDERDSGDGCSPDGCTADLTRDSSLDEESRWSCSKELENETCQICYSFAEPQDIVRIWIALWKGDVRTRSIEMVSYDKDGDITDTIDFTSSGNTEYYESITVNTDETQKLCMEPVGLGDSEWLSILEVQFRVD